MYEAAGAEADDEQRAKADSGYGEAPRRPRYHYKHGGGYGGYSGSYFVSITGTNEQEYHEDTGAKAPGVATVPNIEAKVTSRGIFSGEPQSS